MVLAKLPAFNFTPPEDKTGNLDLALLAISASVAFVERGLKLNSAIKIELHDGGLFVDYPLDVLAELPVSFLVLLQLLA